MPKPKTLFNQRLHAERRWNEYVQVRETSKFALADAGVELQQVWRVVSFLFQPLDGSTHEIPLTDDIARILKETGILEGKLVARPPAPEPAEPAASDDEFFLDGDADRPVEAIAPAPVSSAAELVPPELPKLENSRGNWVKYEQALTKGGANVADKRKLRAILMAKIDRKKRCKPLDMIQFIFEYMGVPIELLDASEVPSAGALNYLFMCQDNPTTAAEFMKSLYPKSIPDKKQMEFESRRRSGSDRLTRKLDEFDAEWQLKIAETGETKGVA